MRNAILVAGLLGITVFGCKKEDDPVLPTLTTTAVSNISFYSATTGGAITSNGGADITASGICWSKSNLTPTLLDSVKIGSTSSGTFTSTLNNLFDGATYYVRAYATNSAGTGYGNVLTFNTLVDTTKVTFAYNGTLVTYGVLISTKTGKKWMDRNLGASRMATASNDDQAYGDLFQWGRGVDGHQIKTSGTTTTLSATNTPGHGNFIMTSDGVTFLDWRNPQNINLWQGSSGVNNPCPTGWHVPTQAEWDAEGTVITDANTAFTSSIKLAAAGQRQSADGSLLYSGTRCRYWSSTSNGNNAIYFIASTVSMTTAIQRALGASIRCIKD